MDELKLYKISGNLDMGSITLCKVLLRGEDRFVVINPGTGNLLLEKGTMGHNYVGGPDGFHLSLWHDGRWNLQVELYRINEVGRSYLLGSATYREQLEPIRLWQEAKEDVLDAVNAFYGKVNVEVFHFERVTGQKVDRSRLVRAMLEDISLPLIDDTVRLVGTPIKGWTGDFPIPGTGYDNRVRRKGNRFWRELHWDSTPGKWKNLSNGLWKVSVEDVRNWIRMVVI